MSSAPEKVSAATLTAMAQHCELKLVIDTWAIPTRVCLMVEAKIAT